MTGDRVRRSLFDDSSLRPYLGEIATRFGVVEILALDNMRDLPRIRIETLYVPPLLAQQPVDPDSDPAQWPKGQDVLSSIEQHRRLVVLGDPGGGKTTLANWLAWRLSAGLAAPLSNLLEGLIPIPCVLRELPTDLFSATVTPADLAEAVARRLLGRNANAELLTNLRARVDAGEYVLILDGVDELQVSAREVVGEWVRMAKEQDACLLATSRTVGYEDFPIDGPNYWRTLVHNVYLPHAAANLNAPVTVLPTSLSGAMANTASTYRVFFERAKILDKDVHFPDLLRNPKLATTSGQSSVYFVEPESWAKRVYLVPFDDVRVEAFAGNWYAQRCASEAEAREKSDDLVAAISRHLVTKRLARTPNLLTLMAVVHRERADLPDGKALLYDEIANAYINTIDVSRKLTYGPDRLAHHDWKERKSWLAYVGFRMQMRRSAQDDTAGILANGDEVCDWLAEAMEKAGVGDARSAAREYLGWVARRSGLLLPRGENIYAFVHLSFQEYFCACYLAECLVSPGYIRRGVSSDQSVSRDSLSKWAGDSGWGEVFISLFEKLSAERDSDWLNDLAEVIWKDSSGAWITGKTSGESRVELAARAALDAHIRLSANLKDELITRCAKYAFEKGLHPWPESTVLALLADAKYACVVLPLVESPNDGLHVSGVPHVTMESIGDIASFSNAKLLIAQHVPISDLSVLSGLTQLKFVDLRLTNVADLSPLSGLAKLCELRLQDTKVTDLAPVASLAQLEALLLQKTLVTDLSPLAGLTRLRELGLDETQVTDLAPLSGLAQLAFLYCQNTLVKDISPLARLKNLRWLSLEGTQVTDLSPLAGLARLGGLDISNTRVTDFSPLAGLTRLEFLSLEGALVKDLSPLAELKQLLVLSLPGTQVTDLSQLAGLTQLEGLDLESTHVTEIAPLAGLTNLRMLNLYNTQVRDLSPLVGLTNLELLSIQGTQVTDLSPLAGLTKLESLSIQGTQVTDLLPLAGLTKLETLSIQGTKVTDLSPLVGLTQLRNLGLKDTQVTDVSVLKHITGLVISGLNLES